ncbi:hypothetical protein C4375_11670 [Devosia sp. I507]|nr:hypothetical protein C4375_11670 [Devosia sp. I507]
MVQQPAKWLVVLLSLVLGGLLVAPVTASAAHNHAVATVVEEATSHGHVHGDLADGAHDAIEHGHDLPHPLFVVADFRPAWVNAWVSLAERPYQNRGPTGPERPPRVVM